MISGVRRSDGRFRAWFREWESGTCRPPGPARATSTSSSSAPPASPAALTADYLAEHAPAGLRWALAGRSRSKLEAVRDRLAELDPALADLELIVADAADRGLAGRRGRAGPGS